MTRGCDYQGYEFGASYLDSVCIDGYLWDADSGYSTDDGWMYTKGGEDPCPLCNFKQAVSRLAYEMRTDSEHGSNCKWFINQARRRLRRYLERRGLRISPRLDTLSDSEAQ